MHAMLQSDGRSPKQAKDPSPAAQLKPSVDSGQNSGNSFNSQVRGKKRDRGDHNSDPIKRDRSSKADDADSLQCKVESSLKYEISVITEKGGVVDLQGVDRLIQLMQPVRTERKMDLSCCSILAGVMAATDKVDCLSRFVQLEGLPIFNEWLQDARRGRIGDGSNSKDRDKSVEEFLLVLLRALDKLPVNVEALRVSNIGKSVNHLRSHKNMEIQRKARDLIDTWKKRVEAEMNSNDAKSGSTQGVPWPSKSRPPEASQGGGVRTPSGSDVSLKDTSTQTSASKTASSKSSHGDANVKSANSQLGSEKQASPPSIGQENHPRDYAGVTENATQVKEDMVSNQSQNCSPSYSVKDDGKSTTTTHIMSSGGTQSKRTSGLLGISGNASHKETNANRSSSSQKVASVEKRGHSALSSERIVEGPAMSEGTNHKLIVKIPNMSSRVSSPLVYDKNEPLERASENKIEAYRCSASSDVNMSSHQDCVMKDASNGSAYEAGPCGAVPDEGQRMASAESMRVVPSLTIGHKPLDLHSSSFSPMNALIESCAKYSEGNTSPSPDDEGGMNLLASVATGEMSRADFSPTIDSSEIKPPAAEEVCVGDTGESALSPEDLAVVAQSQSYNDISNNAETKLVAIGRLNGIAGTDSLSVPGEAYEKKLEENVTSINAIPDIVTKFESGIETEEKVASDHGKVHEVNTIGGVVAGDCKAEETDVVDETHDAVPFDVADKVKNINHTVTTERFLVHGDHEAADQKTDLGDTKPSSVKSDGVDGSASTAADISSHTSDVDGKMKFDLNEGLVADEGKSCDPVNLMPARAPSIQMISSSTSPANPMHHVHSSSITVASAAKGPFVPPDDLLRSKGELGWKGSAATSAFRPAEPRRAPETTQASTSMSRVRFPLDIDLNVADEGLVEEMGSREFSSGGGGLDLDLNAIDETNDHKNCSTSTHRNTEDPSGDFRRAFDLNDGPGADEGGSELFLFNHQAKGSSSCGIPPPHQQPSSSGLRMNSPMGSFSSSWFPAGNLYTQMPVPSVLPDRIDHHPFPAFQPSTAQRPFASTSGPGPLTAEAYRGSVLSSSPAVNFPSGPFNFPVFPFGTSFPVPSSSSPAMYGETLTGPRMFVPPSLQHQQLLGQVGPISSQFLRPYVVNLPESNGLLESSRKFNRSGLDLNAGPSGTEIDSNRDEMFSLAIGQQSIGSSRVLTEEQARMYSATNGVSKRKEREGGSENESFRFKHNSWQ